MRSRGGLTSKIHVIVDTAGKAVALSLTAGQRADVTGAGLGLNEVDPEAFIADKTYDADPLIKLLDARQITAVIPLRKIAAIHGHFASHSTKEKRNRTVFC